VRGKIHQLKAVHWGSLRLEITGRAADAGESRTIFLIGALVRVSPLGIKEGCDIFLYASLSATKKGAG